MRASTARSPSSRSTPKPSTAAASRLYVETFRSGDRRIQEGHCLRSDSAGFYVNRGNLLLDWQRYDAAVADYRRRSRSIHERGCPSGLGQSLASLKQFEAAIMSFDRALALDATKFLIGTCRAAKMQACQWEGFSPDLDSISRAWRLEGPFAIRLFSQQLLDSPASASSGGGELDSGRIAARCRSRRNIPSAAVGEDQESDIFRRIFALTR